MALQEIHGAAEGGGEKETSGGWETCSGSSRCRMARAGVVGARDQVATLVLDAAPFIKGIKLDYLAADNFVTLPEVLKEVRDRQAREQLGRLTVDLKVRTPSVDSLKAVVAFARKTGDYAALSPTDLRVVALAHTIEVEARGCACHLRIEPLKPVTGPSPPAARPPSQLSCEKCVSLSESASDVKKAVRSSKPVSVGDNDGCQTTRRTSNVETAVSDEHGWITPDNIHIVKNKNFGFKTKMRKPKKVAVACMSSDFAVQNTLMQIGIKLLSIDGMVINSVKSWVLRCHACFTITKVMDKQFCPSCGGPTLTRVSCEVDARGNMRIFLKRNYQYNLRGTQYSLPLPRGGRNAENLILREDQKEYHDALRRQRKQKEVDIFDLDYTPEMLVGATDGKKVGRGGGEIVIGMGRKNPNVAKRRSGRKKS